MSNITEVIKGQLQDLNVELIDRAHALSYITARALGMHFTLPTSKVENPYKFFRDTHQVTLHRLVSEINEELVVDVDEVESLVLKLWLVRYRLVHEPYAVQVRDLLTNLVRNGVSDIPQVYTDIANKYNGFELAVFAGEYNTVEE